MGIHPCRLRSRQVEARRHTSAPTLAARHQSACVPRGSTGSAGGRWQEWSRAQCPILLCVPARWPPQRRPGSRAPFHPRAGC
eukprot:8974948-Lingulodinium_polyedra.AAC.1